MVVNNNAKVIRREILSRMSSILLEDREYELADRIPVEMRPRKKDSTRCCIYRDRAVIKYKIMAMLGFDDESEEDELKSLGAYIHEAEDGKSALAPILNVVEEACSSCQKTNYVVTNMCQGCVGRSCMVNCPKDSITFCNGRAVINHDTCVNCGLCKKVCPFHAIIYTPVPCEEACPVDAISKNSYGKEKIDMDNCILCGKCMDVCPFGAIVEKTDLFDVIREIKKGNQVVAMVAPAIAGQFREPMSKILSGFLLLGFSEVREVAAGADITAKNEAMEFRHRVGEGKHMTTSCCPAYVNMVQKHCPELKEIVSETLSPMNYSAAMVKEEFPDAKLVFVGPCVAKKAEAASNRDIDYVLNFEEYGSWLVAAGIELSDCEEKMIGNDISKFGRSFARAGGVGAAVSRYLEDVDFESVQLDNIDRTFVRQLKMVLKNKKTTLVEVMSCEDGCVGGCNTLVNSRSALRQLSAFTDADTTEKRVNRKEAVGQAT